MAFAQGVWHEVEERTIRSELYHQVENACYQKGENLEPWAPNRRKLVDLLEATAAITHLPAYIQPPTWLPPDSGPSPLVACQNGLLDITRQKLIRHTPEYFNEVAVPFAYEPTAPAPRMWLDFLHELWRDDEESITLLQQWFGYILSGATNQQKILGIIGPRRSGKGTICRVLGELVGRRNVAAPTLSSFGQNFGLYDLIGKPVAIIGDVRLGTGEQNAVVERLLTISGEDAITLDRKYRDPWTGRLGTRIMFVSNELPRFGDASGAIATRVLLLQTTESYLGREDKDLTAKLSQELSGILNWSLDGLAHLSQMGRFVEPKSATDTLRALEDLVSPISAFVRDYCRVGAQQEVPCDLLFRQWKAWCDENGHRCGSTQVFGRNLRAVVPALKLTQVRIGSGRERRYLGIGIKYRRDDESTSQEPRSTRATGVLARTATRVERVPHIVRVTSEVPT
jgi:putative DNA primase/helicase